jgi:putative transposase
MGRLVQQSRLLEPIGNISPVEAEERYYAMVAETAVAA